MKRFNVVQNGYDIDEVNRFIDIVIARLEKLNTENVTYIAKIEKLTNQLKNNNTTDYSKLEKAKENEEYYATFSGEKLNFEGNTFNGASLNAIFGGIDLNLKKADITNETNINATSVFGGINIFVPDNVNVEIKSTSLFGGVTNKVENKENQPTIKIRTFCLFGGVEVK